MSASFKTTLRLFAAHQRARGAQWRTFTAATRLTLAPEVDPIYDPRGRCMGYTVGGTYRPVAMPVHVPVFMKQPRRASMLAARAH